MRPSLALTFTLLTGTLACRIETRPPAGAESKATIQESVTEHLRARAIQANDSVEYTILRRQTAVHRDLASVWVTFRETHHPPGGTVRDTTRLEHLLLRKTAEGWIVVEATAVNAP